MARKRKAEGSVDDHEDEVDDGGREASPAERRNRNTTRREEQAAIARRYAQDPKDCVLILQVSLKCLLPVWAN